MEGIESRYVRGFPACHAVQFLADTPDKLRLLVFDRQHAAEKQLIARLDSLAYARKGVGACGSRMADTRKLASALTICRNARRHQRVAIPR